MNQTTSIEQAVKAFIVEAFMYGSGGETLDNDLNLVETRILDSINVLQLVEFIEDTYDVMLEPEELHQLISVNAISGVIQRKLDEG